jgi:hypothetical protein
MILPDHLSDTIGWRALLWDVVLCKLIDGVLVGVRGQGGVPKMVSVLATAAVRGLAELLDKLLSVDLDWISLAAARNGSSRELRGP